MKITFVQTGGTIDKDYPKTLKGYNFEISEPAVSRILERINPNFEFEIISILKKDSLDITDEDRSIILEAIKNIDNDKIIITHGTDTMINTAEVLNSISDKTIVLTGAMRPEKFSDSDAMFNVGVAVGALSILSSRVYIAMNGRIYDWDKCQKVEKDFGCQFVDK
jgi:L-asparaginase